MGDKDLSVTINRAPVLTLWAAVVAERLGWFCQISGQLAESAPSG